MRDPGYYTSTDYIEDGLHTFTQTLLIKIVAINVGLCTTIIVFNYAM